MPPFGQAPLTIVRRLDTDHSCIVFQEISSNNKEEVICAGLRPVVVQVTHEVCLKSVVGKNTT